MKYNPGFTNQYINRFCQVNKVEFKYYKNEFLSKKHQYPLLSLKLAEIDKVQRVNIDIPIQKEQERILNQF